MRHAWQVISSNVEAIYNRANLRIQPRERDYNGHCRRKAPRSCSLCNGPMRRDRRPPRDVRAADGRIRRLPEEVLEWWRCGRCTRSQVGIPPADLS